LLAVQQEVSTAQNRRMVGKTVDVLVEGQSKLISRQGGGGGVELGWEKRSGDSRVQLVGRTRGDQVVVFDGEPALAGQMFDVQITEAKSLTLFGRRV
jgi:tRNA-2-methylthio-N6-dimethylallyladenosine synthase